MIDEYLLEQLQQLETDRENLSQTLLSLTRKEAELSERIGDLQGEEDLGLEVFSPRSQTRNARQDISELKLQIEELQVEQAKIQQQLEQNHQRADRYQQLLLEARAETEIESSLAQQDEIHKEFEIILKRIDHCLNLIHTDKVKCKNELKNLKYYMKALIAKHNS